MQYDTRAAINNLRVSDVAVSRQHCRVQWLHRSYILEDLKSSNGTYLNEARTFFTRSRAASARIARRGVGLRNGS